MNLNYRLSQTYNTLVRTDWVGLVTTRQTSLVPYYKVLAQKILLTRIPCGIGYNFFSKTVPKMIRHRQLLTPW